MPPFVLFGLPRSRTAWLSVFLGSKGLVGHDIGPECGSVAEFIDRLSNLAGTCETGAAFAWPLIRKLIPGAKFVVIRRDFFEVVTSLRRLGLGEGFEEEMGRRATQMNAHSDPRDTLNISFDELTQPEACNAIHEWCLGEPMDFERWKHLDRMNIQVDLPRQIAMLQANRERIETLRAEVRSLL